MIKVKVQPAELGFYGYSFFENGFKAGYQTFREGNFRGMHLNAGITTSVIPLK